MRGDVNGFGVPGEMRTWMPAFAGMTRWVGGDGGWVEMVAGRSAGGFRFRTSPTHGVTPAQAGVHARSDQRLRRLR
jgi:hypothetical protein